MKKIKLTLGASILLCSSLASATIIEGSFTVDGISVQDLSGTITGRVTDTYIANSVLGRFRYDSDYIQSTYDGSLPLDYWTEDSIYYNDNFRAEEWLKISLDFGDFILEVDPLAFGDNLNQRFFNLRDTEVGGSQGVYLLGSDGNVQLNPGINRRSVTHDTNIILAGQALEHIETGLESEFTLTSSDLTESWMRVQFQDLQSSVDGTFPNYNIFALEAPITSFEAHVAPIPEPPEILLFATGLLGLFFARRKLKQGSSPVTS